LKKKQPLSEGRGAGKTKEDSQENSSLWSPHGRKKKKEGKVGVCAGLPGGGGTGKKHVEAEVTPTEREQLGGSGAQPNSALGKEKVSRPS